MSYKKVRGHHCWWLAVDGKSVASFDINSATSDEQAEKYVDGIVGLNLDYGLLKIHSEHQAVLLESCESALAERDEEIKALQQQNTALQQQVKDLQAENKQAKFRMSEYERQVVSKIKAAAIREACEHFKIDSWVKDDTILYSGDLKEYANTLSGKGGD